METLPVKNLENKKSRQQVDRRRQRQIPEKLHEGILHPAVQRYQQILRVADRAHDAAQRHGEGQRQQQHLGRHAVLPGQQQDQRRTDDGERVVHQERRGKTGAEQDGQDQAIGRPGAPEEFIREMKQITAFLQRLPDNEHAEEKQHDIRINGAQRRHGADLARDQHRHGAKQHDLPQPEVHAPDAAHGDQHENAKEDNDGNIHA